jgi:hypothetical protein
MQGGNHHKGEIWEMTDRLWRQLQLGMFLLIALLFLAGFYRYWTQLGKYRWSGSVRCTEEVELPRGGRFRLCQPAGEGHGK